MTPLRPDSADADIPPAYFTLVFDELEFNRNMSIAMRSEKWDSVTINGLPLFSNLSTEEKTLFWDTLKQNDVNFNPSIMDLTLKLAEAENCCLAHEFNDMLKFVINYLRNPPPPEQVVPAAVPTILPSNPAEFATNQPQVVQRDGCSDVLLWCCIWDCLNSPAHTTPIVMGPTPTSDTDCCGDCECDNCDCDCGDCF